MNTPAPLIPATPLQVWCKALFALLEEARVELDARTWSWFIAIACERVGVEAARLAVAEATRATAIAGESETA